MSVANNYDVPSLASQRAASPASGDPYGLELQGHSYHPQQDLQPTMQVPWSWLAIPRQLTKFFLIGAQPLLGHFVGLREVPLEEVQAGVPSKSMDRLVSSCKCHLEPVVPQPSVFFRVPLAQVCVPNTDWFMDRLRAMEWRDCRVGLHLPNTAT
jgi:hypothetical protein